METIHDSGTYYLVIVSYRYIYHIFMGVDGNHSLHKKMKCDNKLDYSLLAGHAFFADCDKMASFTQKTSKDHTVVKVYSHICVHYQLNPVSSGRAAVSRSHDLNMPGSLETWTLVAL